MLKFKTLIIRSINESLEQYKMDEFSSPYRSTIPLLTLFKQDQNLLNNIITKLTDSTTDYIFEFETPVRFGNGLPSCTDLMIVSNNSGIAIEVKRTEPKYPKVKTWFDGTVNKKNVLLGWLELIFENTQIRLTAEQVQNFPYQMIHRLASACSLKKEITYVLYVGFDLTNPMKQYYESNLFALSLLLDNRIQMKLVCIEIQKTDVQRELENRWDNGMRDLSIEVKTGIIKDNLMHFTTRKETV